MTKKYFTEFGPEGTMLNFSVAIFSKDCAGMCQELFDNLTDTEQFDIVATFLTKTNQKICTCSTDTDTCNSCQTTNPKIIQ